MAVEKKIILAKSNNKNQKQESLVSHDKMLKVILDKIQKIEIYNEEEKLINKVIIIIHDLGKINVIMQSILYSIDYNEKFKRVRHNILTGAFIKNILDKVFGEGNKELKDIIYKAVLFHHGSYDNYLVMSESKLQEYIYKYIYEGIFENEEVIYDLEEIENYISDELKIDFKFNKEDLDFEFYSHISEYIKGKENKLQYILSKGMLNLVDHIASMQVDNINYYNAYSKEQVDDLIKKMLVNKLNKQGKKVGVEDIKFTKLQHRLGELNDDNVLTIAFTGAGKTIADYRKHNIRKFFLVPNKISAEGFYRECIFKDEVGLLHGDINLYSMDYKKDEEDEEDVNLSLMDINLTRNFCKSYVIATVDQILLSMFKYPGYEKVFAAIRGSYITIDEVHLLEPKMFLILIYFIQFATKNLGVKFHLMTATMPKVYKDVMIENNITFDEEEEKISFVESNKNEEIVNGQKLKVDFIDDKNISGIIEKSLNNGENILIVKNSIDESINLYNEIKDKFPDKEINLLHSRFKFEDKKEKYTGLLEMKGDIWIATQSVEISLDIDFKNIISDMATMECLIQRMGRGNRHNNYELGSFYILPNKKDVYDEKLKAITVKLIKDQVKTNNVFDMEIRKALLNNYYDNEQVIKYFEKEFYDCKNEVKAIYGLTRIDNFVGDDLIYEFEPYMNIVNNKKEASRLFRGININYKVVLKADVDCGLENLQLKSIQVSKGVYYKLDRKGLIYRKNGCFVVKESDSYDYSKEKGLYFR